MAKRRRSGRPRKAKKAGAKRSVRLKRSAKKKTVSKARPATVKRTALRRELSAPPQPPAGPKRLSKLERHVHIIYVPDNAVVCGSPAHPTPAELKQVGARAGKPSPTDVIVFGGKAYQMPRNGLVMPHPRVHEHKETVLTLHGDAGETAVWWSEEQFTITKFVQDDLPNFPHSDSVAPSDPFAQKLTTETDDGGRYVSRSPVPIPASYGHQYKIWFTMGGNTIDPHMDSEP